MLCKALGIFSDFYTRRLVHVLVVVNFGVQRLNEPTLGLRETLT